MVIEPFTSPRMLVGCLQTVKSNKAKNSNDDDTKETSEFSCPQAGCIRLFKTSTAMQKHIDVGRHCFRPQKDSAYDKMGLMLAQVFVHLMCLLRNSLGI